MTATLERIPTDFWDKWDSTRVADAAPPPVDATEAPRQQRSLGQRTLRAFLRVVITLGIGVGGTLAWQAYGDGVRQLIAIAYPEQLGWIAPQAPQAMTAALAPQSAPAAVAADAPAAPSVDQQQLKALSLNLAAVRQGVEQLATQVAAGQQQMSGEIARLQASEQDIINKIATPPRPAPAARKPTSPPAAPPATSPQAH
jgi:hypothetical protein